MKIERISDNQIKCTLNRSDLASHQIKISELAYGTEKTQGLFRDMMEQAYMECGFEAQDLPLMIEAIPVSTDCIVLMITKVEEPDEVDTDFSNLSKYDELTSGTSNDPASFLNRLIQNKVLPEDNTLKTQAKPSEKSGKDLERIYVFDNLDKVIRFAHSSGHLYKGESSLYKTKEDGRYYMILNNASCPVNEFGAVCSNALEFGSKGPVGFAGSAFVREHHEVIIPKNALQILANV